MTHIVMGRNGGYYEKCIYKGTLKSVYVDKDKAEKVFALSYSKSDVLYEALNTDKS